MAKVIQVTQYEANDGSLFMSAAEADAHDFKLENGEKIKNAAESFLNATKAIDRSRSMQGNTIENFLAFYLPWAEAGSVPVERTVFDTPKEVKVVEGGEPVAAGEEPAADVVADVVNDTAAGADQF